MLGLVSSNLFDGTRSPFGLFCAALVGLVLFGPACTCSSDEVTPISGEDCDEEGERDGNLICEDGIWVEDDADVFEGDADIVTDANGFDSDIDDDVDGDTDNGGDVSCDAESHREFCERYEVECGSFSGLDNCDEERTVHCGDLDGFQCESPKLCAHAEDDDYLDTNQCVCFSLDEEDPESDICAYADAECGTVDAAELCEGWEEHGEVECGECDVDGVECGSDIDNVCGCPCEIDDTCYANGETSPDNECLVCDPNEDQDEFSTAPDGTSCEDDGICEDGQCVCEADMTECDDQCVDLETNRNHCGECDDSCNDDQICSGGECMEECQDDQTACSGECVTQDSDDDHCGECDNECTTNLGGAEAFCDDGECTEECVEEDDTMCDDVCADLESDRNHCGECDNECGTNEFCNSGECEPFAGGGCENDDECGDFQQCCNEECIPNAAQCTG